MRLVLTHRGAARRCVRLRRTGSSDAADRPL